MEVKDIINQQLQKENEYNQTKAYLESEKARIQKELKDLVYPHWLDMLSCIINEVNKAIVDRGFQLETQNYRMFGLDTTVSVFQDYSKSSKFGVMLKFYFNDNLYCYDGDQPVEVNSLNDILHIIDNELQRKTETAKCKVENLGLDDIKDKLLSGEIGYSELPEELQNENLLIQYANSQNPLMEYIPAGMLSFNVLKSILLPIIERIDRRDISMHYLGRIFKYPHCISLMNRELFELGMKAGVRLFSILPTDTLEKLDAFTYDYLMRGIKSDSEAIFTIPQNKMKDEYIIEFANRWGTYNYIPWNEIKGLNDISQETADFLMTQFPTQTFPYLDSKYKSLDICHQVLKIDKSLKKYVPTHYLTDKGNIKRLPKVA